MEISSPSTPQPVLPATARIESRVVARVATNQHNYYPEMFQIELGKGNGEWWNSGIPFGAGYCLDAIDSDGQLGWEMRVGQVVSRAQQQNIFGGPALANLCDDNFGDPEGIIGFVEFRLVTPHRTIAHILVSFDSSVNGIHGREKTMRSGPEMSRIISQMFSAPSTDSNASTMSGGSDVVAATHPVSASPGEPPESIVDSKPVDRISCMLAKDMDKPVPSECEPFLAATAASAPKPLAPGEPNIYLLRRALAAMGGAEKISAITDLTTVTDVAYPDGRHAQSISYFVAPRHRRHEIELLTGGREVLYTDGATGWVSLPSGIRSMALRTMRDLEFYDLAYLLLAERNAVLNAVQTDANTVQVTSSHGQAAKLQFDRLTGLPLFMMYTFMGTNSENLPATASFADWRHVYGLKIPFKTVIQVDGRQLREDSVVNIKLNNGVRVAQINSTP